MISAFPKVVDITNRKPGDTYILLDVLLCSIAEYFYELCRQIVMSVRVKFADIYLRGTRDRSVSSGTERNWRGKSN